MIFYSDPINLGEKNATWAVPTGRTQYATFDSRMVVSAWTSAVVDVVYRLGPDFPWRNVTPRVTLSAGKAYVDDPVETICYPEIGLQVTTQSASAKNVRFVCVTDTLAYDVGR